MSNSTNVTPSAKKNGGQRNNSSNILTNKALAYLNSRKGHSNLRMYNEPNMKVSA